MPTCRAYGIMCYIGCRILTMRAMGVHFLRWPVQSDTQN
jgi:hypothetical protein